jgi:signal transduction histidine kinase
MAVLLLTEGEEGLLERLEAPGCEVRVVELDPVRKVLAHDLRTPLGIILGNAELIKEGVYGPVTPRQVEALQRIEAHAERLSEELAQLSSQLFVK